MPGRKTIGCGQIALAAVFMGLLCSTASAGDYLMVASGPVISTSPESFSGTFDGITTTTNNLTPILDVARLAGGSFSATFRFSTEYTLGDFYDLNPPSGITFDLIDSSGGVVYHGSNFSDPIAILSNNYGGAPYTVDQAALYALGDSPDGLVLPTPLYGPGTVLSNAGLNFSGYVSPGVDYLSDDVNIPINASTYLAFPSKILDLSVQFQDGDAYYQGPYQYDSFDAQYNITALSVTAVPEPGSGFLLFSAVAVLKLLGLRRGRGRYTSRSRQPLKSARPALAD
jgi:hypothetical protein